MGGLAHISMGVHMPAFLAGVHRKNKRWGREGKEKENQ